MQVKDNQVGNKAGGNRGSSVSDNQTFISAELCLARQPQYAVDYKTGEDVAQGRQCTHAAYCAHAQSNAALNGTHECCAAEARYEHRRNDYEHKRKACANAAGNVK